MSILDFLITQNMPFMVESLKLLIPFLFSLLLILANRHYNLRREKKEKNNHLWTGIIKSFDDYSKGCDCLDNIIKEIFDYNTVIYFNLDFSKSLTDYACRLAEIELKFSPEYSTYIAKVEIVRNGHRNLITLLNSAAASNPTLSIIDITLKNAIKSQVNALKKDLIIKAEAELTLLRCISRSNTRHDFNKIINLEKSFSEYKQLILIKNINNLHLKNNMT